MEWIHRRLLAGGGRIGTAVSAGISNLSPSHYPKSVPSYRRIVDTYDDDDDDDDDGEVVGGERCRDSREERSDDEIMVISSYGRLRRVASPLACSSFTSSSTLTLSNISPPAASSMGMRAPSGSVGKQRCLKNINRRCVVFPATSASSSTPAPISASFVMDDDELYEEREDKEEWTEWDDNLDEEMIRLGALPGVAPPQHVSSSTKQHSPTRREQLHTHAANEMIRWRRGVMMGGQLSSLNAVAGPNQSTSIRSVNSITLANDDNPDKGSSNNSRPRKNMTMVVDDSENHTTAFKPSNSGKKVRHNAGVTMHLPRQPHPIQVAKGVFGRVKNNAVEKGRRSVALKRPAERSASPAKPRDLSIERCMRMPFKFEQILHSSPWRRDLAEAHSWNPDDRSKNIYIKNEDRLTIHRHPVAQSTDAIRGKIGHAHGYHVWEITWPRGQRGTHPLVGVATKTAPLHAAGYTSLVGLDEESYGWDLARNLCGHNSEHYESWPYPSAGYVSDQEDFRAPDTFFCILDMDEGTLAFATHDRYLGVAFCNLKRKKLYPIISAVWGHCEITLRYLGGLGPEPRQLMEICKKSIRKEVGNASKIGELSLPPVLLHYLVCNH